MAARSENSKNSKNSTYRLPQHSHFPNRGESWGMLEVACGCMGWYPKQRGHAETRLNQRERTAQHLGGPRTFSAMLKTETRSQMKSWKEPIL